jgi:hypothetical protein
MPPLKRISSLRCLASLPNSKHGQTPSLAPSPARRKLRNKTKASEEAIDALIRFYSQHANLHSKAVGQ